MNAPAGSARIEGIVGRYAHIEIDGKPHRLYFEEAGQGIPLLCLHTAGSDGRQFRAVLTDPQITRHFRVVHSTCPGTASRRHRQAGKRKTTN